MSPGELLKQPNRVAFTLMAAILILAAVIVAAVMVIRYIRRKKARI